MNNQEQQDIAQELALTGTRLRELTEGRPVSFILTYCVAQDIDSDTVVYVGDTIGALTPLAVSPEIAITAALTVDAGLGAALTHLIAQEDSVARQRQGEHLMRVITTLRLADVLPYAADNEPVYANMQQALSAKLANSLKWRERDGEYFASFGEDCTFKIDSDDKRPGRWRIAIKVAACPIITHDDIPSLDKAQQLVAEVWLHVVGKWGHEIAFQAQSG